ncbi:MAG TPA: hypothetical protein VF062_06535 [Candidatus Limnocylindrales bacterium]
MPELPEGALECRQRAELLLTSEHPEAPARATAWALLAVAAELAEIRRELKRRN